MTAERCRDVKQRGERFIMLGLYSSLVLMQSFQFLQYTIIANITTRFFNVSTQEISLTSVVNFIALVFLTIPSNYLLHKIGVRNHLIIGATLISLGTIVKWYSNEPDRFYASLGGQTLVAMSSPILRPMARQVSRLWFPAHEVSRATSVVLLSIFAGNMLAAALPVYFVPDSKLNDEIEAGLNYLFSGQAVLAVILFTFVVFFFKNAPIVEEEDIKVEIEMKTLGKDAVETIPSTSEPFFESLYRVINKNVILLIIVGSIGCSVHLSFMTVFNEFLIDSFNNNELFLGFSAFLYCGANVISTFFYGYVMDKRKCYKSLLVITNLSSIVFLMIIYLGTQTKNTTILVSAVTMLGCTVAAFAPISFNFAADLTYPEPESVSAGLLIISSELSATLTTVGVSYLIDHSTKFVITAFYVTSLFFAIIFTSFIKMSDYRIKDESSPISKDAVNKDYTRSCH